MPTAPCPGSSRCSQRKSETHMRSARRLPSPRCRVSERSIPSPTTIRVISRSRSPGTPSGQRMRAPTIGPVGDSSPRSDRERADRGELSPTGPIVGARMRWPDGVPGDLEREITRIVVGDGIDLSLTRHLGEGSRRALRMWVSDLRWEHLEDPGHGAVGMRVYFVLPKGGY